MATWEKLFKARHVDDNGKLVEETPVDTINRHAELGRILQFRGMELLDEADAQSRVEEAMAYRQAAVDMVTAGIGVESHALELAVAGVPGGMFRDDEEKQ